MSAGEPAWPIEFRIVEAKLAYKLRMFRTAALNSIANIEDHEPVPPITQVSQAVDDLNVVQIASAHLRPLAVLHFSCVGIFDLPTSDFHWILRIFEIDHAQ